MGTLYFHRVEKSSLNILQNISFWIDVQATEKAKLHVVKPIILAGPKKSINKH